MAADRAAAGRRAGQAWRDRPQRHRVAFLREQITGGNRHGAGRERRRDENASEPRAGKAAEDFYQTRCDAVGNTDCRGCFSQFGSGCASWLGGDHFRRGDHQRRGSGRFNINPRKRSIKTYGLDKGENGGGCGRSCVARGRNNHHFCCSTQMARITQPVTTNSHQGKIY